MKRIFIILFSVMICAAACDRAAADDAGGLRHRDKECCKKPVEETCSLEKRGRCGKRRGDWYGARRPVTSLEDARQQFISYYSGQQLTVAEVSDKRWRYEADVLDSCSNVVDRVMIDKRSGRVRSIY